jgi:TonB-dependent SusC/RagA subfamily outer membrane receptor
MKQILFLPLLFVTILAGAQTRSLHGKIVSSNDQRAVSKASITIKNGRSFIADDSGAFKIEVPAGNFTLSISSIGFAPKEIFVSSTDNNITISLTETDKNLNEVVVVGYSDKKKGELTSSVTVVDAAKLKDVTTNDVGNMLQGKVAGLQVVNSSGVPGANAELRLRGVSSINASQSPLYVVDGIIGGNFDPNDVESITVLKDAAATAMYGSQANAGVIVVTTKKAKSNKTAFEVKATTGFRTPDFGKLDMMTGSQLYNYQKEFYRDYIPSDTGNSHKIDLLKFYAERPRELQDQNHNWMTTIFNPAFMQNYYVSISGKTEKNDYYIGASYYNEKGTFMNTNFQRVNLRASSTLHLSPKISLTNAINISGIVERATIIMISIMRS